jgi:hypothetical protein
MKNSGDLKLERIKVRGCPPLFRDFRKIMVHGIWMFP